MPTTLKFAISTVLPLIGPKRKHVHYQHVVALTKELYRPLITGEGADHLIKRFNMREDEEAHKQRIRLTTLITPAVANTLMAPARKVAKVKPVVSTAEFTTKDVAADGKPDWNKELQTAASQFHAGKSVDHYFGSVLLDQGAIDPNAFCLVLFNDYDSRFDKPVVYPSLISAEDAWNFEYFNGELQWLLVHRNIKYEVKSAPTQKGKAKAMPTKPPMKDGHAFWMYTDQHHIMLLQVDTEKSPNSIEGVIFDKGGNVVDGSTAPNMTERGRYFYRPNKTELYEVVFYEHKAGMVQAFRLGFVPDQRTKGETMLNLWHAGTPYMLKGIKSGSELDMSASLHAFLQKLSYENPCRGYNDERGIHTDCNEGKQPGGNLDCKACKGTGYEVHGSGQDHITLRMPRSKDEAFDLAQLTHYVELPVEVLKWQNEYVTQLENSTYAAVYNSSRFRPVDASSTTATGDIIDLQSVYDTLKPVADWYSRSRVKVYKLLASFVVGSESLKTLNVVHEFPRNMRFETLAERVNLLKGMREAGASNGNISMVDIAIGEDLYADDPEAFEQNMVRNEINPFLGKTEATIVSLISQDLCTKADKVFWTNENKVYALAVEQASEKKDEDGNPVNFWRMPRDKQREIIDGIVEDLISEIDDDAPAAIERAGLGLNPDEPPAGGQGAQDPNNPDPNKPPASPGDKATK